MQAGIHFKGEGLNVDSTPCQLTVVWINQTCFVLTVCSQIWAPQYPHTHTYIQAHACMHAYPDACTCTHMNVCTCTVHTHMHAHACANPSYIWINFDSTPYVRSECCSCNNIRKHMYYFYQYSMALIIRPIKSLSHKPCSSLVIALQETLHEIRCYNRPTYLCSWFRSDWSASTFASDVIKSFGKKFMVDATQVWHLLLTLVMTVDVAFWKHIHDPEVAIFHIHPSFHYTILVKSGVATENFNSSESQISFVDGPRNTVTQKRSVWLKFHQLIMAVGPVADAWSQNFLAILGKWMYFQEWFIAGMS